MKIAITGATGLVGKALARSLAARGDSVVRLVRRSPTGPDEVRWDPAGMNLDPAGLEGLDGVVHLAGENIASGRWTAVKMDRIRESRVQGTKALADAVSKLSARPGVFVCASAIGYYGDRGDEILTEDASPGEGFLPEVCRAWEAACEPARAAGIRVANLRIGVVLAAEGGALGPMVLPFRMGVGGRLGDGRQYWSWITLRDLVRSIEHVLDDDSIRGEVNAVAPEPVTNLEFTRLLGRVLGRPTLFPMPAFAARILLGKMAEGLLLASARVVPRRLQETGFRFEHTDLEAVLRELLGR